MKCSKYNKTYTNLLNFFVLFGIINNNKKECILKTNTKNIIVHNVFAAFIILCTICFVGIVAFCINTTKNENTSFADYYTDETFTITFHANGGSGTMADATEVVGEYTLPECTYLAQTGYQFYQWSIGGVRYNPGQKINVTSNIDALAIWELQTFSVNYKPNGGTGTMPHASSDDVQYNHEYTIKDSGFSAPSTNHYFSCWAINSPTGEHVNPNDVITITEDTNLYAVWGEFVLYYYTVSFDSNGGTGTIDSVEDIRGDFELPLCTFVAPEGKRFKCWDANGTEQNPQVTIQVFMDMTIKAVWEDIPPTQYEIAFLPNGGTGVMTAIATTNNTYTLPECSFTPPNGMSFKCWSINNQPKNVGETISVTGNIQLIAVWEDLPESVYTIKFSANGGTGTMQNIEMAAGTYTLPECTFVAPSGKKFKSWAIGNTKKAPGATIEIAQDITITAIWEKETATPQEKPQQENKGLPTYIIILIVLGGIALLGGAGFGIYKIIKNKKDNQHDWYNKK